MINLDALALKYHDGRLLVLDQRRLPTTEHWVSCRSPQQMCEIIKTLQVRGAPLIGIAAALALADFARRGAAPEEIRQAAAQLAGARPTAINLRRALDRLLASGDLTAHHLGREAAALFHEDRRLCEAMADHGAGLIDDGDSLLTHCNTGSLVTAGSGTALGAIKRAWAAGKRLHVYVNETRPLLQGARLTAWELDREGIPYTLICDSMAAALMAQRRIHKVMVGADRVALNGDVANKIGTYNAAVVARFHRVPFYVVAPYTTLDPGCRSGLDIPIEERGAEEVRGFAHIDGNLTWAPQRAPVSNPAFDVTPAALVTALVLDRGVIDAARIAEGALEGMAMP